MFYLDKLILNYLYDACENMGRVFGLGPEIGAMMWIILTGGIIAIYLGKRGNKC